MAEAATTPVPERSAGIHFPGLDAFRGIGMTLVLINHAAYTTGFVVSGGLVGKVVARSDAAVPLFFVLSAFLLFRPVVATVADGRPAPGARRFWKRRALRILPAYWVALVGLQVLFGLPVQGTWDWIANALFLPAVGVPAQVCSPAGDCHVGYGITQAWSVGVEVVFYLVLPLWALLLHRLARGRDARGRWRLLAGSTALLYLGGAAFRMAVVATDPSWARQSLLWLPMHLDVFALGMALAVLSEWAPTRAAGGSGNGGLGPVGGFLTDHPVLCWVLGAAAVLALVPLAPPSEPFGLNGAEYVPRQAVYGLAAVLWLWPGIFGRPDAGHLRRALASRPLVYAGTISLSFYLWHLQLMEQVKRWTVPNYAELEELAAHPPPGNPLAGLATFTGNVVVVASLSWILSFVVASVLFRLVELPFLRRKVG